MNSPSEKLVVSLGAVDWNKNVADFCSDPIATGAIAKSNMKLAIWSRQFESIDLGNPALCFIREMQSAGHIVATAVALSMYKAAAASCRTILESALYYSYFRTHPSELTTLVRDRKWYISKKDILLYHATHSAQFNEFQKSLPVVAPLNDWYGKISAIIHGQIPGAWLSQQSISKIKTEPDLQSQVIQNFDECVDIVSRLFFCTVGNELWDQFSTPSKKVLTAGMRGDVKTSLSLDSS